MATDVYRSALSILYPLFFIISLLVQLVLLFLIIFHSPKSISNLRIILALTCVFQLLLAFSCWFNQLRLVPTDGPTEMRSYGPCKHLGTPWLCYVFYQVEQESGLASGLTIYATFFLKYKIVSNIHMSRYAVINTYLIFYLPLFASLIAVTIIFTTQIFPFEIRGNILKLNANLTDYQITAYLSLTNAPNMVNLVIVTGCILIIPAVSLHLRRKILHSINGRLKNMSPSRQVLYRNFLRGLTIQVVLPYIIYFPIYGLDYYCAFTNQVILLDQYLITFVPAFPSLLDPLVSLYCVTPYRKKLISWIKREPEANFSHSTVIVTK